MIVAERYGGAPEPFQMATIDEAFYSMVRDSSNACWHYVLGRVGYHTDVLTKLCSLGIGVDGELICGVNFSKFLPLSLESRKAMLKYLCTRFFFGHLSSVGERLKSVYGEKIFNTAACIAIDQVVDLTPLMEDGYVLPSATFYGFPEKEGGERLDTEDYCQLLKERDARRKAETAAQLQSLKDMFDQITEGADLSDPEVQEKLAELFGPMFRDDKAGQAPDTKPPLEPTVLDGSESSQFNLNKPPAWVKNGKIDNELLKKAVAGGEVDLMPIGDLSMDMPPELADVLARRMMLDVVNHTDIKSQGWFRGETEEFIKFLSRTPVVGWTELLRRRERTHVSRIKEPTRRRPSRRHVAYWGRKVSRECDVVAWVDTSGSMGERPLACIAAELTGLVRRGCHVRVGQVDADVQQDPVPFTDKDQLEKFFGRGGTDFRPAFTWAATQLSPPDFMVYFTDGMGIAPDQPPEFMREMDILWVLTDDGMSPEAFRQSICKFGDVVVLDTHSGIDDESRFNQKGLSAADASANGDANDAEDEDGA